MQSYPLKFKTETISSQEPLSILDAEKNPILYRTRITDDMQEGSSSCVIFSDKTSSQPLYNTLYQKDGGTEYYLIRTPGNTILGKLVIESKHSWKVLDEHDTPVASIRERGTWKDSCLGMLLTLPMTDDWFWMKIFSPHTFLVLMDGRKVLNLHELATINDEYKLTKKGDFSEREEVLLLVSLMMVL